MGTSLKRSEEEVIDGDLFPELEVREHEVLLGLKTLQMEGQGDALNEWEYFRIVEAPTFMINGDVVEVLY